MYKIRTKLQGDTPFFPNMLNNWNVEVCLKEDVDKALFEKDKEIAELKQKLEDVQATAYADSVDAGMRERRLRRALWLARAYRAKEMCQRLLIQGFDPKWEEVERKCLKKAEECK